MNARASERMMFIIEGSIYPWHHVLMLCPEPNPRFIPLSLSVHFPWIYLSSTYAVAICSMIMSSPYTTNITTGVLAHLTPADLSNSSFGKCCASTGVLTPYCLCCRASSCVRPHSHDSQSEQIALVTYLSAQKIILGIREGILLLLYPVFVSLFLCLSISLT